MKRIILLALLCVLSAGVLAGDSPLLVPGGAPSGSCPIPDVQPEVGMTLPCRVVSVHDGDTLTVEIVITQQVRLLDCWAPELRESGGKESGDYLRTIAVGKSGVLHVPIRDGELWRAFSFGRSLGHVWIDGETLSSRMVKAGHATKKK